MTNQELNKRFAELCGICWHEWVYDYDDDKYECSKCLKQTTIDHATNPDFVTDPRLVLREMEKRSDFHQFITTLGNLSTDGVSYDVQYDIACILRLLLDTTRLLVKAAIEFLETKKC